MAKNKLDLTIDIQMAENGGIVVKYMDRDEESDDKKDGPMFENKTYTFKNATEASKQITKWLGEEENEEKNEDEVPTTPEAVKAHLHEKNIGSTARAMKGY